MKILCLLPVFGLLAFLSEAALAAPCIQDSVANYQTLGASGCTIGPLTFTNFSINTVASGDGAVALGNITPVVFQNGSEYGFILTYASNAGPQSNSQADLTLSYNVQSLSNPNIPSFYVSYVGNTQGTGIADLSANLTTTTDPGYTVSLLSPENLYTNFPNPAQSLHVLLDQHNLAGASGHADTSIIENAFTVPGCPPNCNP